MEITRRGLKISEGHDSDCAVWTDEECTCWLAWDFDEDFEDEWDHGDFENSVWELENEEPPIRTSKTAKPKHGVDGRSIFTIWDKARGK